MTNFTDQLRTGGAIYQRATATYTPGYVQGDILGVPLTNIFVQEMGQVPTASAAAIATATAGITGAVSLSGIAVGVGVATTIANLSTGSIYTIARKVAITSTADATTATMTITGTDFYGATLVSTIAAGNNTTVYTQSAYKTVTAISVGTGNLASSSITIGTSDRYGFQFRLDNAGQLISITADGISLTATAAPIAGLTATGVATATTVDVRGTVIFPTTGLADGSKYLTITYVSPTWGLTSTQSDTKEQTYGPTPFSG